MIIFLLLLLTTYGYSWQVSWQHPLTHWKKPDLLFLSPTQSGDYPPMEAICREIALRHPIAGIPHCRIAGEWERDSSARVYLHWLSQNLDRTSSSSWLLARNASVHKRIQDLDDRYLWVFLQRSDTLWATLFSAASVTESSVRSGEPLLLAYKAQGIPNTTTLADLYSFTLGKQPAQRRWSEAERKAKAVEMDPSYGETPRLDQWVSLGGGWTQAQFPFTPDSWYQRRRNDRIVAYSQVRDSLSAWSLLEEGSPLYALRAGFTWNGHIGGELFAHRSQYQMKIAHNDSSYTNLDYWRIHRTELGLLGHGLYFYQFHPLWEWQFYAQLGFLVSLYQEDIRLIDGTTASGRYTHRIRFEKHYKGAVFATGSKILWADRLALDLRAGIANRGRGQDEASAAADGVAEPTIIGGSTLDFFATIALEYHWRSRE